MPFRDENELMQFNGKAAKQPVVLQVNQDEFRTKPVFNFDVPLQFRHQQPYASLIGEFVDAAFVVASQKYAPR